VTFGSVSFGDDGSISGDGQLYERHVVAEFQRSARTKEVVLMIDLMMGWQWLG
jgi:hypothetical protein